MMLDITTIESPLGPITLVARGEALLGLEFGDQEQRLAWLRERLARHFGPAGLREMADPAGAASRLGAYFAGDLAALAGQPVELLGTSFQRAVWIALREIPVGCTESYGALAARIGAPQAVRAVGAANGSNPIGISRSAQIGCSPPTSRSTATAAGSGGRRGCSTTRARCGAQGARRKTYLSSRSS